MPGKGATYGNDNNVRSMKDNTYCGGFCYAEEESMNRCHE